MASIMLQEVIRDLRAVPWEAVAMIAGAAFTVALVLLRDKMRKPDTFVTSTEHDATRRELSQSLATMAEQFRALREEVKEWELEFRDQCATTKDLNGFGERVTLVERFQMALNDGMVKANTRSARALREVKHLRENLERLESGVTEMRKELRPVRDAVLRVEEALGRMAQHNGGGRK